MTKNQRFLLPRICLRIDPEAVCFLFCFSTDFGVNSLCGSAACIFCSLWNMCVLVMVLIVFSATAAFVGNYF